MSKTATVIVTVLVLALIGVGVIAFTPGLRPSDIPEAPNTGGDTTNVTIPPVTNNTYNTTYVSTTTLVAVPVSKHVVSYTNAGFFPSPLFVNRGDSVTFVNNSSGRMWVASDPHPYHSGLPGFDQMASSSPGASWTYAFGVLGTFNYHNHMNPSVVGTIVVQ